MKPSAPVTVSESRETSPDDHLRHPWPAFGRWWTYWALLPLVTILPASRGNWVLTLVGVPLFFWSGLRPMRLWMHRPRPAWLFFVLWLIVPFVLFLLLGAALRAIGLSNPSCCG